MTVDPTLPSRLTDQEARYGINPGEPPDLVCTRADGVYLWDVQGNRFLDLVSGNGAAAQGHNHTRIAAAMVEQCLRLCLTPRASGNDRLPPLLEKLCTLAGFAKAMLLSTGAEAVAAAIRGARGWGCEQKGLSRDQTEIILFADPSRGADDLSGLPAANVPGFRLVPFGDLAAVKAVAGPATCAVLVEPIQAGACVVPPKGFLRGLRELCDSQRILLIADEIECGLGRTGKLFGFEHEDIRPDAIIIGKCLSGGFYPVSALLGSQALLAAVGPSARDAAFAGNPLACAVASAALDVLLDEKLVDRSAELGAYLLERLRALDGRRVREIRGIGLCAGIELRPEAGDARSLCAALRREGLLCQQAGQRLIRLAPALIITREQMDWALGKLKQVLEG